MATIDEIDITSLLFQEGSAPSTPASTKWRAYFKTDGLYVMDDAGTEIGPLATGGAGLGAWTTYTPTWTASGGTPTLGNGTLTGRYKELDANTGLLHIRLLWGNTTSSTGSTWAFSLPAGWTAGATYQILAGHIADSGSDHKLCVGKISPSGTTVSEIVPEGGNTVTPTVPMTWTTNDQLNLSGIVELA